MIKLVIGNSVCQLNDLPIIHFRALRKLLSYKDSSKRLLVPSRDRVNGRVITDPVTKRPKTIMVHPTEYLLDKRGQFPTGLLYIVIDYFKNIELEYLYTDTRIPPKTHTIDLGSMKGNKSRLPYAPYPEQVLAAKAASSYGRGIIVAPTGLGKSAICVLIIEELQVPTLIVVPSLELKTQLTNSLREAFGVNNVGALVKGKKRYPITVENVDQLDPKKPVAGIDCIIIDEFHRSGAATYRKLNAKAWTNVYYRFGLTATPFRSKEDERLLLESVLSQVIYKVHYCDAVDNGYIVPMEAYYIEIPKSGTKGTTYAAVYKELIVNNKHRNDTIVDIMKNLYEQGLSTLVLVKQIDHGLKLQEQLALEHGIDVLFAQGINDDNRGLIEAFNCQKTPILIGTVGVLGEGVDTKPCEYVILAGGGKSRNQFHQNIGRAFRRYPGKVSAKVILFKDTGHKWFLEHFKTQKKHLLEDFNTEVSLLSSS